MGRADPTSVQQSALRVPRYREAFEQTAALRAEIPEKDVRVVNLDVFTTVFAISGCIQATLKLREQTVSDLPRIDPALYDALECRALAMGYAHALYLTATRARLPVKELSAELVKRRAFLVENCALLARYGLFSERVLSELQGAVGFKNQVSDVLLLIGALRERWSVIAGRAPLTLAELDEAEYAAYALAKTVGERQQLPAVIMAAAHERDRAFTLFIRCYDELRRAAHFHRWYQRDADKFVPVIYVKGKRVRAPEVAPAAHEPAAVAASADNADDHKSDTPEEKRQG